MNSNASKNPANGVSFGNGCERECPIRPLDERELAVVVAGGSKLGLSGGSGPTTAALAQLR